VEDVLRSREEGTVWGKMVSKCVREELGSEVVESGWVGEVGKKTCHVSIIIKYKKNVLNELNIFGYKL